MTEAQVEDPGPWRHMSDHRLFQEINQSLVAAIDVEDGDAVVDLGCGDGAISRILLDRGEGLRIWAVDPDPDMLASARSLIGARVATCPASAETFGDLFPPASCDAVVAANNLHLVGDRGALYENLRRVLVPRGLFAFNTTFYLGEGLRASSLLVMAIAYQARKLARKQGLEVRFPRRRDGDTHLVTMLPPADDLVDELRAAAFEPVHVDERTWLLDQDFLSSFLTAPYEMATVFPDFDPGVATPLLQEAIAKVVADQPEPVPRTWLTVVARRVHET